MSIDIAAAVAYPESDGLPMADNTIQWDWMAKVVGELRELFAGQRVFVAGNLFWYPVEGETTLVTAPDAMVAFGRPPGDRGSYKQWEEDDVAPQVVFEILSPSNTDDDLDTRFAFFEAHGVEEYYFIDPYENTVLGYRRRGCRLVQIHRMQGFVSPRLGVKFERLDGELVLTGPDGRRFQTREDRVAELAAEWKRAEALFAAEQARSDQLARHVEDEKKRADDEKKRADAYAAKLRALGIDPDQV